MSGDQCGLEKDIPSISIEDVKNCVGYFCWLKSFLWGSCDAVSSVTAAIQKYFDASAKITEYLKCFVPTTKAKLEGEVKKVQKEFPRILCRLDMLCGVVLNDYKQQLVNRALKANNIAPLKALLKEMQQSINEIMNTYRSFNESLKALEDSFKEEWKQFNHHQTMADSKLSEICSTGLLTIAGLGVITLASMGTLGGCAAGYWLLETLTKLGVVFGGIGFGTATGGMTVLSWQQHSKISDCKYNLDNEVRPVLERIEKDIKILKDNAEEIEGILCDCSADVDVLLTLCKEQGHDSEAKFDEITKKVEELKSKKTKYIDEQKKLR